MHTPQPTPGEADVRTEPYRIVALASSAGGVTALGRVLGELPSGFGIPVVVVQHLDPRHETVIADILGRRVKLRVVLAQDGVRMQPGSVYIAPPNRHLLVDTNGVLTLSSSELVHFLRPSADLLFESIAGAYGAQAIACVLTGTGSDGAMGVRAVKDRGGTVIAQDPDSADFSGMPDAAIKTGAVDFVLPIEEISGVLTGLAQTGSFP
ncbi:hypothetical protein GCM10010174_37190 [Kutzneria viridogrisea]|nr:chemotaxis protein CheB [Kutzneria albida]MBA8930396.1 two-component system chemotaxis response regulator CheB [Kutzneria viridogrisea]